MADKKMYNLNDEKAIELLKYLVESGTIDVGSAEEDMKKSKLASALAMHPYKISLGTDGRWFTYLYDETKPRHRRKLVKPTLELLHEALYDHYMGEEKKASVDYVTLEDIYPEWLEYKSLHTSAHSTITRINNDWNRFYKGTEIALIPLRQLTKLKLDSWAHRMIKEHKMDKTLYYNFSGIMRQCLDFAVDKQIVDENVFRKVRIDGRRVFTKKRKKPSETQVYSREELAGLRELALADYNSRIKTYQLAPLAVLFQFETGVRIGEVCVLRYEDIEGPYLHVRRMLRRDIREVVEHTKGGR